MTNLSARCDYFESFAHRYFESHEPAMEYVIVTFPTNRLVYVDGEENGKTNEVLRVDAGTHVFELGNLANYRPESRKKMVKDTTALEPLEIPFFRKDT